MERIEAIKLLDGVKRQAECMHDRHTKVCYELGLMRSIIMDHLQGHRSIEESLQKLEEMDVEHA